MTTFYDWFNMRLRAASKRYPRNTRANIETNMKRFSILTEQRCRDWADAEYNKSDPFAYPVARAAYQGGVADPEDYSAKTRT